MDNDTNIRKLFKCPAFAGTTRSSLMNSLEGGPGDFRLHVIFGGANVKKAFREHVSHILETTSSSDDYNLYHRNDSSKTET